MPKFQVISTVTLRNSIAIDAPGWEEARDEASNMISRDEVPPQEVTVNIEVFAR